MNEIGNNLKKIRILKNLSLKKAGALLNMSATAVSKYEQGLLVPDSQKLIQFASAYEVKCADLLKVYTKPSMKFISFRKKKSLTGKNLNLLKELIEEEVAKHLEVVKLNNISINNIKIKKYSCNGTNDAEIIASNFRKQINISNKQPISDLINILENLGIIIITIKNTNNRFNGFDGLSEIVDNIPIIVLLDDIKDGARQRFTIAHELGHLLINNTSNINEEILCNRFASALLMPKEAVINEFGFNRNNISIFELTAFTNEYKVSYKATVYRLKDLEIISEYLYKKLFIILNKNKEKITNKPIPIEKSYHFKKTVYKLEIDNIITINKACELLGVTLDEYNNENNNYRY